MSNIHPLVVHFPIALLSVYSLLEVLRIQVLTRQPWYFGNKVLLLITGTLGGAASLLTGDVAKETYIGTTVIKVVEMHEMFAQLSMLCYGILCLAYCAHIIHRSSWVTRLPQLIQKILTCLMKIKGILTRPLCPILLSSLGFLLLCFTGALGGALVYGPEVDPIVSFIYHLLFQ